MNMSPDHRFTRLEELIGSGVQKSVYKAYDLEEGSEVAWNSIPAQCLSTKDRARIEQEISFLQNLNHKNIVKSRSVWNTAKEIIFITEYLPGGSLRSYLRILGPPRRKLVKAWSREILEGLSYLHRQSIIHRDIKLDNIFIDSSNGHIKIGDFGLSTRNRCSLSYVGTQRYLAREIYEGDYDTSVDIYAFGLLLLEMCTDKLAFSECKYEGCLMKKVINQEKPLALQAVKDKEVLRLIEMCLLPAGLRPTAEELLSHPFYKEHSQEDTLPVAIDWNVPMSLKVSYHGNPQLISFMYDVSTDTPDCVAINLIEALGCSADATSLISSQITRMLQKVIS